MKTESKSAPFLALVACFSFFVLSGCADTRWPTWITGEPSADVLAAPRDVRAAPRQHMRGYPNLATVPQDVPTVTPAEERARDAEKMQIDQARASKIKQRIDAQPVIEPWPLPPPGRIDADDAAVE